MVVRCLAQLRHLGFHIERTVKHNSLVASDSSWFEDAVTDINISQVMLASRTWCCDYQYFSLAVVKLKSLMSHPCFLFINTCLYACKCNGLVISVLDLRRDIQLRVISKEVKVKTVPPDYLPDGSHVDCEQNWAKNRPLWHYSLEQLQRVSFGLA